MHNTTLNGNANNWIITTIQPFNCKSPSFQSSGSTHSPRENPPQTSHIDVQAKHEITQSLNGLSHVLRQALRISRHPKYYRLQLRPPTSEIRRIQPDAEGSERLVGVVVIGRRRLDGTAIPSSVLWKCPTNSRSKMRKMVRQRTFTIKRNNGRNCWVTGKLRSSWRLPKTLSRRKKIALAECWVPSIDIFGSAVGTGRRRTIRRAMFLAGIVTLGVGSMLIRNYAEYVYTGKRCSVGRCVYTC